MWTDLPLFPGSAYYYVWFQDDRFVEQVYTYVPQELEKKASLLKQFGLYEEKELKHDQSIPKTKELNKVYLLKYYVSEEAITFRLSNGVIQVKNAYMMGNRLRWLILYLQYSSTFSSTISWFCTMRARNWCLLIQNASWHVTTPTTFCVQQALKSLKPFNMLFLSYNYKTVVDERLCRRKDGRDMRRNKTLPWYLSIHTIAVNISAWISGLT